MDGVPLIIDFVERGSRAIADGPGSGARGGRGPGRGRPQAGRRERAAEGPEEVEDDRREL